MDQGQSAPLLLFERVSKWYGPVIGVNQVTLELRPGITGLVGSNGAGKSTLLRLATGQLRPDLGRVRVRGEDAWSAEAKQHVGYCPETDAFYEEMSGRQFVEAMTRLCGYPRDEAVRRAGAALQIVEMNGRAERKLRGYSKGMRQRIKLAQALVHDPELLVLDEPLSGIDPVGRQEFVILFRRLAEQGKCLIVSSHELEELEKLTDHVAIMARGRIAAVGTLAEIRELLDDHPFSIQVECADHDDPRALAKAILGLPDVEGVEIQEAGAVVVRARNPRRFFRDFAGLVLEESLDVRRLETLDDSAQAILGYLLGGRGR
ncbi:MAG TPA: ABC transporter ATP-binding protein [Gemmataceae bacterium]